MILLDRPFSPILRMFVKHTPVSQRPQISIWYISLSYTILKYAELADSNLSLTDCCAENIKNPPCSDLSGLRIRGDRTASVSNIKGFVCRRRESALPPLTFIIVF